ncbi:hypothetical protein C8R46DRAFT_1221960 [Mycena filopes]|nr:hypothetical protein C8R46DRAFT_1221960 [Mycena filopes]
MAGYKGGWQSRSGFISSALISSNYASCKAGWQSLPKSSKHVAHPRLGSDPGRRRRAQGVQSRKLHSNNAARTSLDFYAMDVSDSEPEGAYKPPDEEPGSVGPEMHNLARGRDSEDPDEIMSFGSHSGNNEDEISPMEEDTDWDDVAARAFNGFGQGNGDRDIRGSPDRNSAGTEITSFSSYSNREEDEGFDRNDNGYSDRPDGESEDQDSEDSFGEEIHSEPGDEIVWSHFQYSLHSDPRVHDDQDSEDHDSVGPEIHFEAQDEILEAQDEILDVEDDNGHYDDEDDEDQDSFGEEIQPEVEDEILDVEDDNGHRDRPDVDGEDQDSFGEEIDSEGGGEVRGMEDEIYHHRREEDGEDEDSVGPEVHFKAQDVILNVEDENGQYDRPDVDGEDRDSFGEEIDSEGGDEVRGMEDEIHHHRCGEEDGEDEDLVRMEIESFVFRSEANGDKLFRMDDNGQYDEDGGAQESFGEEISSEGGNEALGMEGVECDYYNKPEYRVNSVSREIDILSERDPEDGMEDIVSRSENDEDEGGQLDMEDIEDNYAPRDLRLNHAITRKAFKAVEATDRDGVTAVGVFLHGDSELGRWGPIRPLPPALRPVATAAQVSSSPTTLQAIGPPATASSGPSAVSSTETTAGQPTRATSFAAPTNRPSTASSSSTEAAAGQPTRAASSTAAATSRRSAASSSSAEAAAAQSSSASSSAEAAAQRLTATRATGPTSGSSTTAAAYSGTYTTAPVAHWEAGKAGTLICCCYKMKLDEHIQNAGRRRKLKLVKHEIAGAVRKLCDSLEETGALPDQVKQFQERQLPRYGPRQGRLEYDTVGDMGSKWNKHLVDITLELCSVHPVLAMADASDVYKALTTHLRYRRQNFKRDALNRSPDPDAEEERRLETNRYNRQHNRHDSRLFGLSSYQHEPTVKRNLGIMRDMDPAVHSKDESKSDGRLVAHHPVWRSRAEVVKDFFRVPDTLLFSTHYRSRGCKHRRRGQLPAIRTHRMETNSASRIPVGLPENMYDEQWLQRYQEDEPLLYGTLKVQPPIDLGSIKFSGHVMKLVDNTRNSAVGAQRMVGK